MSLVGRRWQESPKPQNCDKCAGTGREAIPWTELFKKVRVKKGRYKVSK